MQRNRKINVSIHNGVKPDGLKEGPTNYVNVTFDIATEETKILHCFHGPTYRIENISVEEKLHGVIIHATINGKSVKASISILSKSLARDVFPVKERRRITGYSGYATVWDGETSRHFGHANNVLRMGTHASKRRYGDMSKLTPEQQKVLPNTMAFTSSYDDKCSLSQKRANETTHVGLRSLRRTIRFNSTRSSVKVSTKTEVSLLPIASKPDKDSWKLSVGVVVVVFAICIFYKVYNSSKRETVRRNTR